jgi:hypothetical protein
MDLYSIALGGSMLALGSAALLLVVRRARLARAGALASLVMVAFSLAVHLPFGHRPGTDDALSPIAFLREHPSFLLVPILAFLAFRLAARGRPNA